MTERKEEQEKQEENKRDEEVDTVKACEVGREWMKKFVGNLNLHSFRIEQVKKNGAETRYIVIMSISPDLGEEREYFLVKVDVVTGNIVGDIGKGKMIDEKITFTKFDISKDLEK